MYRKVLTVKEAEEKIKHFCAYQERNHSEVKQKLYSYGLFSNDINLIISNLIEENFLNEERFSIQFTKGKFNQKHWGKNKIKYELSKKQISNRNIVKGLSEIDEKEYVAALAKLTESYYSKLTEGDLFIKRKKTQNYLLQKGYEFDKIIEILKSVIS